MSSLNPSDYHVLVVDDDKSINQLVQVYLQHHGFRVSSAFDGVSALAKLANHDVDLVILDRMMPNLDGAEVCKQIRLNSEIPVLMLTARGEREDKLHGFEIGADDYLVKPFDPNELVARTTSLIRRTYLVNVKKESSNTLRFGNLVIDPTAHNVMVNHQMVELTSREYKLLRMFVAHPNHVLNRQQLIDFVWGIDYEGEDRVVDVFVKRIRKKLQPDGSSWSIVTVRGEGYQFRVER